MKLGNYETNEIYNEDCIKAMQTLPNECIDFILTDPPYNINFSSQHRQEKFEVIMNDNLSSEDFDKLLNDYFEQCFRVLKNNSFLITFMGWSTIPAKTLNSQFLRRSERSQSSRPKRVSGLSEPNLAIASLKVSLSNGVGTS